MSKNDLSLLLDRIDQLSQQLAQQTRVVAKLIQQVPLNQSPKYNDWITRAELSKMTGLSEKTAHKLCIAFGVEIKEFDGIKNNRYRFKTDQVFPRLLTTSEKWRKIDLENIKLKT